MPFHSTPLNDGNSDATDFVEQAIDNGFWHIDTASIYGNEESVGVAIRESGLTRRELYITTKYDGGNVREEMEKSLKKLGVSYVDLYLIHFPGLVKDNMAEAWAEFEKIKSDGLAKSIGVSNFAIENLVELLKTAKVVPAANQVLFHPYNYVQNASLLEFSAKFNIVTEAYSSLTPITKVPGGPVDKPIQRAAKRLNATPAQVILSWVRSKGVVIVTSVQSTKKYRLKEYLEVADLPPLTAQEILDIETEGAKGPTALSMHVLARRVVPLAALTLLGLGVRWLTLPMTL
ncbi:Aldo/keto reductase [Gautieria morchelliformis]|nr:Aldo/keto reductase [Gautieria morchelliformis]